MNTTQDMRGLFYIVKGQYRPNKRDTLNTDGYNPEDFNTSEWYQLRDCKTHHCIACGSNLRKVLRGVYTCITRYKTAKTYFKYVDDTTTEDYYRTHYLGKPPYTQEERTKRGEDGRSARVSPEMKVLFNRVYEEYGDYYRDMIEEVEDEAYKYLASQTPMGKSKKILAKTKRPKTPPRTETPTPVVEKTPPKKKSGAKSIVIKPHKIKR